MLGCSCPAKGRGCLCPPWRAPPALTGEGDETTTAVEAAQFAAGVKGRWLSSAFSKYWLFFDVHLSPQTNRFLFSQLCPSGVLLSLLQSPGVLLVSPPGPWLCWGECWINSLTSIFTSNHSLFPLLPPSPTCKYCSLHIVRHTIPVWDIFNKAVSGSRSPYFGFELLQVLPFTCKCAAVGREVGRTWDHVSPCSTGSSTASFFLPWTGLVSLALLQHPGTLVGPVQPLTLYRPFRLPPGIFKVIFVIWLYTHQKHHFAHRTT